jgi:hypothetical protein
MRFGDDNRQLKLFISYACHIMQIDDRLWTRLGNVFSGGLKYMVGSHDLIFWGSTVDDVGEVFAANLHNGWTIDNAWRDATGDWWHDNDPAVMTTGVNRDDCYQRLEHATYNDLLYGLPALRDGAIGYYCYYYWNNV